MTKAKPAKPSAAYGSAEDYEEEDQDQYREKKVAAGARGYGHSDKHAAAAKPSTAEGYEDEEYQEDQYRERKAPTGTVTGAHPDKHAAGGKPAKGAKPSTSELMSSAKIIAGVAKGEKVDKAKVCEAASNILDAASSYGGLNEKEGLGSYVSKAEDMLRKYGSGGSGGGSGGETAGKEKKQHDSGSGEHETKKKPSKNDEDEGGSGGFGDYFKVAQGFLKG